MPFFLTRRKPMTPYGGMGCGTKCGKWVSEGKMQRVVRSLYAIIGVVSFWKESVLNFFPVNQGISGGCTLSLAHIVFG